MVADFTDKKSTDKIMTYDLSGKISTLEIV